MNGRREGRKSPSNDVQWEVTRTDYYYIFLLEYNTIVMVEKVKYESNYGYQKIKHPFLRSIWYRVHKNNLDWLWAMVGQKGSGKSYASLHIASILDPNFTPEKNMAFSVPQFMNLLNEEKSPHIKRGSVIIFEEAGVNIDNRKFHSTMNKVFIYTAQVMRNRNLVVLFTVPNLSFIDKKARNMLHCISQAKGYDGWKGYSEITVKVRDTNPIKGKEYDKFPRILHNGRQQYMKSMKIPKIDKDLAERYEEHRKEFTDDLQSDLLEELEEKSEQENAKKSAKEEREEVIALLKKNPEYGKDDYGRWNATKISMKCKCSYTNARKIRFHMAEWEKEQENSE